MTLLFASVAHVGPFLSSCNFFRTTDWLYSLSSNKFDVVHRFLASGCTGINSSLYLMRGSAWWNTKSVCIELSFKLFGKLSIGFIALYRCKYLGCFLKGGNFFPSLSAFLYLLNCAALRTAAPKVFWWWYSLTLALIAHCCISMYMPNLHSVFRVWRQLIACGSGYSTGKSLMISKYCSGKNCFSAIL